MRYEDPGSRGFRRFVVWQHVLLLGLLCACCSPTEPLEVDMTARKVVLVHATAAFEVAFDAEAAEDRAALTEFRAATAPAQTRADLVAVWAAHPALEEEGADFLQRQVFARAENDGDWPSGDPPSDEKSVYVDAVREAIAVFLGELPEEAR